MPMSLVQKLISQMIITGKLYLIPDRDSSVSRASGFGPRGPGFESCLCQSSQKRHWAFTPVVASPYQGVKLGPGLGLGIQS